MKHYGITFAIAVLVAVVLASIGLAIRAPAPAVWPVYFNFVGFQNSTNGWEAVFYVTNWPRASTSWVPVEVAHREGNRWRTDTNYKPTLGLSIQNQTNITVRFRLQNTNTPVRTITRLDSEAEGWFARTRQQIYAALRIPARRRPGTVRWITNEITSVQWRVPSNPASDGQDN